jgi:sugar O-acyltransferase (sialic acid O-acetyltransferase NeuD family)
VKTDARGLVIFGIGGFGEIAKYYFEREAQRSVVAFTVDGAFVKDSTFLGRPLVPFEEVAAACLPSDHDMFVAVGYLKHNDVRTERSAAAKSLGYGLTGHVSPNASVPDGFVPKEHCFIMERAVVQPYASVGANVVIWSLAFVGHHAVIHDNAYLAPQAFVGGRTVIGANTFLGANSTVRDDVTVGRRCMVGAGALIMSDMEDGAVHVGAVSRPTRP